MPSLTFDKQCGVAKKPKRGDACLLTWSSLSSISRHPINRLYVRLLQVVKHQAQRHVRENNGSSRIKPHQRNIFSTSTRPSTPCPQELCRHRSHASAGKRHRRSDIRRCLENRKLTAFSTQSTQAIAAESIGQSYVYFVRLSIRGSSPTCSPAST